jgi:hypothetical protein
MSARGRPEALFPPWADGAQRQGGTMSARSEGRPVPRPGNRTTAPLGCTARDPR